MFKYYDIKCLIFEDYVATPIVPYSTVKYSALAGIMVTASHNPKQDNGYKVYWTNGAQIIEPHDKNIREHIYQNLPLLDLSAHYNYIDHKLKEPLEAMREKVMNLYFEDSLKRVQKNPADFNSKCKSIVYTAMHGVGYIFTKALLLKLGFKEPIPVKEQVIPDPEFPTVVYPNPEEGEGALVPTYDFISRRICRSRLRTSKVATWFLPMTRTLTDLLWLRSKMSNKPAIIIPF